MAKGKRKQLSAELRDLPERFAAAVLSLPKPLGQYFLYVSILKYPPDIVAPLVGIPLEEARSQLVLARSMLRHLVFERGEPRS